MSDESTESFGRRLAADVAAEADEAERDPDEGTEPDETGPTGPTAPEPEREPAPAPPEQSAEALDAAIKKAERASTTYGTRIRGLLGAEAENLLDCPLCLPWARGFIHMGDVGNVPDDVRRAIEYFVTGHEQVTYARTERFVTCPECEGEGKVLTGSHVPQYRTIACPACGERGYRAAGGESANGTTPDEALAMVRAASAPSPADDDVDPWGDPRRLPDGRDNPNFGRMVQYKVPLEPWGVTWGHVAAGA